MNFIKYWVIFILFKFCEANIDTRKTLIWGPGLSAKFSSPIRYFYIQPVDKDNKNITDVSNDNAFKISIIDLSTNHHARTLVKVFERRDGSFLTIYGLFNSYNRLEISITHENKHVAKSPYLLEGFIQDDSCNCPEEYISEWYKNFHCNESYTQIEKDMNKFEFIDMNEYYEKIVNKFNQPYSYALCYYVILNNEIYRKCFGEYVGFSMFSDAVLLSLARKVKLPDIDFFMNLGDWPLSSKRDSFLPIVSWCGSEESFDLILPTYDLTKSTLDMLHSRQSLDMFTITASKNAGLSWSKKFDKGFWRGRDSRQERLDLVLLSKKYPLILDAALTNMFFFREKHHLDTYGPTVKPVSFFEFFKYKYQINIDGTVAAYRFPYLLAGGSVVFKQQSKFYEHFYADLQPYIHYIPIKNDLSDLIEKLEWATKNDDHVRKISKNAQEYAWDNLQPNHIFCYHAKFFEKYSKKLKSKVTLQRDNMEHIKQPSSSCNCSKIKKNKLNNEL